MKASIALKALRDASRYIRLAESSLTTAERLDIRFLAKKSSDIAERIRACRDRRNRILRLISERNALLLELGIEEWDNSAVIGSKIRKAVGL